jgi:hypothetical protein
VECVDSDLREATMPDASKKWLADYFLESGVKLVGEKKVQYVHPNELYELHLSNVAAGDEPNATMRAQIYLFAPDIKAAEAATEFHLTRFLHVLSFVASTRFRALRRTVLIDWSPGLETRDALVYSPPHTETETLEALKPELLNTVRLLHSWGAKPYLDRALRWYSSGVRSDIMEDQFQYFWYVIELIANAAEDRQFVTDKCQKCRGDLICSACGNRSTHRPFPRQVIEALLARLSVPEQISTDLFFTRNTLLHGDDREAVEQHICKREPEFSFAHIVDVAGEIAWAALLNSFGRPAGVHNPLFLKPETYVDYRMSVRVVAKMGVPGDANDPQFENLILPAVTIIKSEKPSTKPEQVK